MPSPDKEAFNRVWPKCFIIFLGIIEVLATIVLIITELGNVGANFWTTNVFAGGWCGLIMLVHFIALFVTACCSPGPASAFRAVIITIIALLACATLISFDAVFIAQPSTCILTSSCSTNAASTTMFSYYFQQAFFTLFNNLAPFKSYTQTQTKFLFQTIQLGVGGLCFVLCIVYLIIYYVSKSKSSKQVSPGLQSDYRAPQPGYQQQQQQQQGFGYPNNRRY
jgi:hypothetical protein